MPRIRNRSNKESARSRIAWLCLLLSIAGLAAQTVRVHVFPDERVARQAKNQYWAHVNVSTSRGSISDRSGLPLAISVPSLSFFIDPMFWNTENAHLLEPYFGTSMAERFASPMGGRFRWVVRKMPISLAKELTDQKIPGLFTIDESQRMYPHGELASHVIGFCDIDDNGLSGLEKEWNEVLYSPPQTRTFVREARGGLLDFIGSNAGAFQKGVGSLRLTIDSRIQQIVEWKLKQGALETKSSWGVGICVDPKTGAVLAMASYPWIDLNDRRAFSDQETLRNSAIGRVYEPGSTFKPIMLGIAMEMGHAARGEQFHCSGRVRISDGTIGDVSAHGRLDLPGLLVKSCNTGMATLGNRMNAHKVYGMLKQFGFGTRSDIEISGEEEGLLRTPEEWLGTARANIAIGQGLAVTPLQLVMAISAIANGGELLKPYIIAEVKNGSGRVVHEGRKRVRNAVLGPATCTYLREALYRTVEEGTGKGAKVKGVKLAGKTGTAQIASRGEYAKGQYVSSFIGFWPYDEPEYVMLIAYGEPKGGRYYGGQIAAPVFKEIVEDMEQISVASRAER